MWFTAANVWTSGSFRAAISYIDLLPNIALHLTHGALCPQSAYISSTKALVSTALAIHHAASLGGIHPMMSSFEPSDEVLQGRSVVLEVLAGWWEGWRPSAGQSGPSGDLSSCNAMSSRWP